MSAFLYIYFFKSKISVIDIPLLLKDSLCSKGGLKVNFENKEKNVINSSFYDSKLKPDLPSCIIIIYKKKLLLCANFFFF